MKRFFTFLAAVLLTATVWAQSPEKMSYQAVIRNADQELVTNTEVGMQISILQTSADGVSVYTETQMPTSNANGLISLEIGMGNSSDNFSTIDWSSDVYFIKTETDPTGGSDYTIIGVSQLLSVPYALHAKTAENVANINVDYADITNKPTIPSNNNELTNGAGYITSYSETQTLAEVAALNDSVNTQLKNVTNPTDAQDAATKAYVDALETQVDALNTAIENLQIETGILVQDYDGNIYNTVVIGTQRWMAENLRVTHYPNGDAIPYVTNTTDWGTLADNNTDDAYCYYDNNTSNADPYGALYTYAAAIADDWARDNSDNQGICPDGWHLPTDAEWKTLEMELGMSESDVDAESWRGTDQGSQLAGSADLWNSGNLNSNSNFGTSGFSALPTGWFDYSANVFGNQTTHAYWWCSDEGSSETAWDRIINYTQDGMYRDCTNKSAGFSVRCLKN